MSNNESLDIPGYRKLPEEDLALFCAIRELEDQLAKQVATMMKDVSLRGTQSARHIAIAQTQFETAFMFLGKAVTQPSTGFGAATVPPRK